MPEPLVATWSLILETGKLFAIFKPSIVLVSVTSGCTGNESIQWETKSSSNLLVKEQQAPDDKGNQFSGKKDDLMQRMERLKASRDAEIKNVPKRI